MQCVIVCLAATVLIGQAPDDVYKGIRDFGVSIMLNIVLLCVLWYVMAKVLPAELERRQKSFDLFMERQRDQYNAQITLMREDYKEDEKRNHEVITVQRTEFLGALHDVMITLKDSIVRSDKLFEALTAEVKMMRQEYRENRGGKMKEGN